MTQEEINYEKELTADIHVNKMVNELRRIAKQILSQSLEREPQIITLDYKIARYEKKFEEYQLKGFPTALQKMCLESVIKYRMQKIHQDHCII